jgi:3-(3-hydroxy-phenyl)propionate hydroxylase
LTTDNQAVNDRTVTITQGPALVVGAGPVGLAAALALRAHGLPATVLEAAPRGRQREGSRAIYVHGATLRTLERVTPGLGWRLAELGLVWPTRRTCWRGHEVFVRTYDTPAPAGKLPHFTSLPQIVVEEVLLDACTEAGVDTVWDASVAEVDVDPDGVTVKTDGGDTWRASYVIGADGARSAVRASLGIELAGSRSENSFVIVDVTEVEDDPLPLARTFHYEHPEVGDRHVLLVPFAGGWRVDLQCRLDDDPEAFSGPAHAPEWVGRVLGDRYAERLSWVTTYRFLQVLAERFVDPEHRVLLVGEAAHLFAPFGARGMNSGVADADAAAAAIAAALGSSERDAARAAIGEFAADRYTAAEWNRECAGKALDHLQPRSWHARARIAGAATLARWWEPAGEWLDNAPYGPRDAPPTRAGTKY